MAARRKLAACALAVAAALATCLAVLLPAAGTGAASALPGRMVAYHWAEAHAGAPYAWGGTGPGFDCSGLVMEAYRHAGISLPRDTFEMLAAVVTGKLIPESHPRKGDLAFYGRGHVELQGRPGHTFGALNSGSPVWWHRESSFWHATLYFRVRGAG